MHHAVSIGQHTTTNGKHRLIVTALVLPMVQTCAQFRSHAPPYMAVRLGPAETPSPAYERCQRAVSRDWLTDHYYPGDGP